VNNSQLNGILLLLDLVVVIVFASIAGIGMTDMILCYIAIVLGFIFRQMGEMIDR